MNPTPNPNPTPFPIITFPIITTTLVTTVVNNAVPTTTPPLIIPCPSVLALQQYQAQNLTVHQQLTSTTTGQQKKRKLSEQLGEDGVICYESIAQKKILKSSDFSIFDGRDVFDLVRKDPTTGEVTIFEAKGGKSQFGTRKGKGGKKIKQCTKKYALFIANKMKNTKYKGRHPRISCGGHPTSTGPVSTCKNCVAAERQRRNQMGTDILNAHADPSGSKLRKKAIRSAYNKTALSTPSLITSW